jgi:hypothetical protein
MGSDGSELMLRDKRVASDENGNICLNDLWALEGSPPAGRPVDWKKRKSALALEAGLQDRMVQNLHHSDNTDMRPTSYVSGRGRGSRTYAHPVLPLDYAEFLNLTLASI